MRVLLAEDNKAHRELLEVLIRSGEEDSRVTSVETGRDFLKRMSQGFYDIALLDYHLPDFDAHELLPRIEDIPHHPPVIIISSDGTSDTIIAALRSGSRDFLPKEEAFNAHGLMSRIRDVLRRRELERQLIEKQKEEGIAKLAGGLAHDFNNMLVGVLGKAALLRDAEHTAEKRREYCDGIIRTAERMADLARQLLAYARGGKYDPRPVNPNDVISDVLSMLKGAVPQKIQIRQFLARELWAVEADRAQLVQALLNLCLNGCEAMGREGTLSIFTENVVKEMPWTDELGLMHMSGPFVHIVVADTGCGVSERVRRTMFDPYVSTKGDGRGLGLPAVKGIVTSHGGGIQLNSDPGSGSAFHIFLPRAARVTPDESDPVVAHPARNGQTVLVVEDEADVREVVVEILERVGHRVLQAESVAGALDRLRDEALELDVVLIDIRLPDGKGSDVLRAAQRLRPRARYILTSGYERVTVMQDLLTENEGVPFLAKPFQPAALLNLVAEVTQTA